MKKLDEKKNKIASKMAGKKIAAMDSYWKGIKKRDPNSYSYPFHQARAIEKEHPKEFKAYQKKHK